MVAAYYFDVLPVRPAVEPLESLTSYLTRLAQENGISSVDGISAVCFPSQDRRITREFADYPPTAFEIVDLLGVSKTTLSRMTFFHLGVKFGRSPKPQALSRFLAGSIAPYLRYCPSCLATQPHPYYPLLWRFLGIQRCTTHDCKLLDQCGHCGCSIPLFMAPFKVGRCPSCGSSLEVCHSKPSSEEEVMETLIYLQDLELLLSPLLSIEARADNIAQAIGLRFKHERKAREFTAVEVANRIGVTLSEVEGIERGNILGRGAKFQSYVKYAQCLGIPLRSIFNGVLQGLAADSNSETTFVGYPVCPRCYQSEFVIKFGHNHSGSQRYRCQYCHQYFTPCSASSCNL